MEMSLIGGTFMFLTQLGNNVYSSDRSKWLTALYSLVGIGTTTLVCILSYFYNVDGFIFNTFGVRSAAHIAAFAMGVLLVIIQTLELGARSSPTRSVR